MFSEVSSFSFIPDRLTPSPPPSPLLERQSIRCLPAEPSPHIPPTPPTTNRSARVYIALPYIKLRIFHARRSDRRRALAQRDGSRCRRRHVASPLIFITVDLQRPDPCASPGGHKHFTSLSLLGTRIFSSANNNNWLFLPTAATAPIPPQHSHSSPPFFPPSARLVHVAP